MENQESRLVAPSEALQKEFVLANATTVVPDTGALRGTFHGFVIGEIGLLLPKKEISEVLESINSCRLPNTSPVLYGMANLRGKIVPLFDLHRLLGIEPARQRMFLVVGDGGDAVGVLLDRLPRRVVIAATDKLPIVPPLPPALRPFARAAYDVQGVWLDWDLAGFFASLQEQIR